MRGLTRRVVALAALLSLVTLAAACGARVSPEQLAGLRTGAAEANAASASQTDVGVGPAVGQPAADSSAAVESAPLADAGETSVSDDPATARTASAELTASDVGITADTITLGHVTELSGPVPGLFEGSAVGIKAVAAYFNSKGGLAGRKVLVDVRDDQFDATQNRNVTRELIAKTFALVGGISLFDDASAPDVQKSGIPDISVAISRTRAEIPNNFAPGPQVDGAPTGQFLYFKERYPEAIKSMGSLYGDVPAAKVVHDNYRAAAESLGYVWKHDRGYQPTETDYTADIIRMRQLDVKAVFLMSVDAKNVARILKAAAGQNWKPDVWMLGASSYDRSLPTLAGPAADGIQIFLGSALFQGEDAAAIPEVKLFNDWVAKVRPKWVADTYASQAWTSGRLLEQAIVTLGPNPTRAALNDALRGVTAFTAHGMSAETGPGVKRPASCYLIAELQGGVFRRVDPKGTGFRCEGSIWRRP